MIFSTYWFVAFALVAIPTYWIVRLPLLRRWWLAVCCIVFHAHFAGAAGVIPIVCLGVTTYLAGLTRRRAACMTAIAVNVAALVFYKYTRFLTLQFVSYIEPAWGQYLWNQSEAVLPAAPPLGISFFVFEFVHYLYDVCHGENRIGNPLDFLLFAIFFPSLVAGPIKRFENFLPAMRQGIAAVSTSDLVDGSTRIAVGYFKKVCIADNLTAWIGYTYEHLADASYTQHWLFFLALGGRIYMDFSGYSDIALGTARLMGIRLPENFNWPYRAVDIQDFWRRWHISLSTWIRDYVYIPLGGGRYGPVRTVVNGLVAFGLCGLWHGAAWNTAFWGVYHGAGLGVHRWYRASGRPPLPAAVSWFVTQAFVFVGWVFFFYPMDAAFRILRMLVVHP